MALSCAFYLSRPRPISLSLLFSDLGKRGREKFSPGGKRGEVGCLFQSGSEGVERKGGFVFLGLEGGIFFLDECEKWTRSTSDAHFRYTPFSYGVSQERNLMAS